MRRMIFKEVRCVIDLTSKWLPLVNLGNQLTEANAPVVGGDSKKSSFDGGPILFINVDSIAESRHAP
jgi:hypothetical protein